MNSDLTIGGSHQTVVEQRNVSQDETMMDPALALEEFSKLASSYGFDLGAQIEADEAAQNRDHTTVAFLGKSHKNRRRGTMAHVFSFWRRKNTRVAVKTIYGTPGTLEIVKVNMSLLPPHSHRADPWLGYG